MGKDTTESGQTVVVAAEEKVVVTTQQGFGFVSLIGLAFAILNSWTAMATSMSLALPSGGPSAVIWGIVPAFIGNFVLVSSLAELCAAHPTPGGQYDWAYLLSPPRYARSISWICGWFSVCGWVTLAATGPALAGQLITGAVVLAHPNDPTAKWHVFIVYVAFTLISLSINVFGVRALPKLNQAAIIWSLAGLAVITITVLACSSGRFATGKAVFETFRNDTGWPDGIAWILGTLQACFGLTAFDGAAHMVEELPLPTRDAPRVMILSVCIGAGTGWIFLVALLFCVSDIGALETAAAGPLFEALRQATRSDVGAICLGSISIVCMAFTSVALLTASSRMTWAFARDKGLPFSSWLGRQRDGVPVNAILVDSFVFICIGCLYLGSDAALSAVTSASVVALNLGYCIPIALLLIRGRGALKEIEMPDPRGGLGGKRRFSLGPILGPIFNVTALAFTAVTTVFFLFPPGLPVDASSMNYAVVVIFIFGIVSAITWVVKGRNQYTGPRDLGVLVERTTVQEVVSEGVWVESKA